MADTQSTTSFRADISQLKSEMRAAGRAVSLASAEFKAATAGMDSWSESADGLQAKLASLDKTLEAQKKILSLREQELQKTIAAEGENSAAADRVRTAMLNQQAAIAKTEKEIRQYTDQLDKVKSDSNEAAEGTEKYKTATEKLSDTIQDQEAQLKKLKDAYKDAKLEGNTEDADEYAAAIKELSSELAKNKAKLKDADDAADDLDKTLVDVEDDTQKASDGFTTMKGVLANLVARGIEKAISGLKKLGEEAIDAYKEFNEGEDNVIKATGATGEAAEQLAASYKNVTKEVRGSFSELGEGLGEINTRFGFTDSALENATVKFRKFSEITGKDTADSVRLVSRAMEDGQIPINEYGDVLDLLAKASQASGIQVDTLAESVAKYGAPMRALGFDTKASIALFAQWEKTGVNTEIAFSGMKKAISNWAKDGKDARVEFGKTLDEIAKAPNIAEATTKAIEVFGAKAGPDLADAIQGGRFAYEDFLAVLEDSQGTVEATYEETQDGYDKIQLAIQNARAEMGSYTGELVKKYQPQIQSAIEKAVKAFKDGTTFVIQNQKTIVGVIQAIAAAFVTYKVASTVATVFDAFTKLFSLMQAGTGIVAALNTVLAMNPYVLLAAGIAAATVGLAKYIHEQNEAAKAEYGLNQAQQETVNKSAELKSSYNQLKEAKDQSIKSTTAEFDYIRELKDEYNGLIDSNGSVKEGYEDRADFIIGRLAEAMGVEREQIEETIGKNGQLGESIDQLIQKKQAEATLAATQDAYTTAIQKRNEALTNYLNAQKVEAEAETKYQSTLAETSAEFDKYQKLIAQSPGNVDQYYYAQSQLNAKLEESKKALADAKQGVSDAEAAYTGYGTTIQNWESLSQAAASGSEDAIATALTNIQNNFQTAETGTKTTLQNQLTAFQKQYADMKAAVDSGMPGVTQAQVEQSKNLVDAAQAELNKLAGKAGSAGTEAGSQYASSLGTAASKAEKSAEQGAESAAKGLKQGTKAAETAGKESGEAYAKSVKGAESQAKTAGDSVGKATATAAKNTSTQMNAAGQYTTLQYGKGVESKKSSAQSAGKALANSAKKGAESVSARSSGENFGKGFENGIASRYSSAFAKAKRLAQQAVAGIKAGQQEGSPSKITFQSGKFFTQGYINGIASRQRELQTAVQTLVKAAVNQLNTSSAVGFAESGRNAATAFTKSMADTTEYNLARMNYENTKKIQEYDNEVARLRAASSAESQKIQAASDKKVAKLQAKVDKTKDKKQKKKLQNQITAEKAAVKKRIAASEAVYTTEINAQEAAKAAYQSASQQMITEYQQAMQEYQQAAQELIDSTINGISERYTEQYNILIGKQESLIDKLKKAGSLFNVSGAGVMSINDLRQQTEAIRDYTTKLQDIKQKVSSDLFDEIVSFDMKQGSAFLDRLLAMSGEDLQAYNDAYVEKMQAAEEAANSIYKTDFDNLAAVYTSEIEKAFAQLPAQLQELGAQSMKGFVNGLTKDTDYMDANVRTFVSAMVAQFRTQLDIHSPSRKMFGIGSLTGEGFNDGLISWLRAVETTSGKLAEAAESPIDSFSREMNRRIAQTPTQGATAAQAGTQTVTNNYNLVQNNTSPKALTALETYQARRQQIAMIKAFA